MKQLLGYRPIKLAYIWEAVARASWQSDRPSVFSLQVFAWYWPPVAFVALVGVCVGLYATLLQPRGAPIITRDDYTVAFTITSFALALLLVFRTNTSYDRCHPSSMICRLISLREHHGGSPI